MSQYTDTNFGFSFWYPTAWKLTDGPVADPTDPTGPGWFSDATIVKELHIRNPARLERDQPSGVVLRALLAPAGLTELGQSMSASPVGLDVRYFFDNGTHRWMYARLSEAPSGAPPATFPLEIKRRTMGGLPLFGGAVRHGGEVIVPLDESHFLAISTLDVGGDDIHTYLAATLVATNLDSGKRVNSQLQAETIHREAVKLRAIGEGIGEGIVYWYKDSQHVYNYNGDVLRGADPKTFVPLSRHGLNTEFATDGVSVYGSYCGVIRGADPKTFAATDSFRARDAHHTYECGSDGLKIGGITARE
jgi:hypothetical protein